MITSLLCALVGVLGAFVANALCRHRHNPTLYVVVFLITLLLGTLFGDRIHASEMMPYELHSIYAERGMKFPMPHSLTLSQQVDYERLRDFHRENAERTYNDAENRCWYFPDVDDRHRARECFTIAMSTLSGTDLRSRAIAMIVTSLVHYGLDCLDEWEYINNKLLWSQYHWEMYEFYCEVLEKA